MTNLTRKVHCTRCHPNGGDIDREDFLAYKLQRADIRGERPAPRCSRCGEEMTGTSIYRNGHSEDGWEPED